MNDSGKPIALEAYETLARAYAEIAETKAENGYNEHPAMRAAIGDVAGLTALDAGCGPGFLVRDLLNAGAAHVTGLDASPAMIDIARKRMTDGGLADRADFLIADLGQTINLPDRQFDLVVSSLAIDYVRDWSTPLCEFRRLLKDGGRLYFSVQHPMAAYDWYNPPSYFGVHYCEADWKNFTKHPVTVPDYFRPFEEIVNPVLAAGFRLTGIRETKPADALRDIDPEQFRRNSVFPTFMLIEADCK